MKRLLSVFDARDAFVGVGFVLVYVGLTARFGYDVALIVVGAIILVQDVIRAILQKRG